MSAAVYTQTTDVEIEVNGLMTYDRALVKMDADAVTAANKKVYTPRRAPQQQVETGKLTPPATPLVACDPYFSIWSPGRQIDGRRHHPLDRQAPSADQPGADRWQSLTASWGRTGRVPALEQKRLTVLPTRTHLRLRGRQASGSR